MRHRERVHLRRIFEESLRRAQERFAPPKDVMVDAVALDDAGNRVVVARYKLYVDGRIECFELLDEVLWPPE